MFRRKKDPEKTPGPRKKRKQAGAQKPRISYKITLSNYGTLSNEEKRGKLREFVNVLAAAEKRLEITMVRRMFPLSHAGVTGRYPGKEVFFSSAEDIGPALDESRIGKTRLDVPRGHEIEREYIGHLKFKDGSLARIYTVHDMGKRLHPAWIGVLFSLADEVSVHLTSVPPGAARKMLAAHASAMASRIGSRYAEEAASARQVSHLLQNQETSVFSAVITAMVRGSDLKELKERCRKFEKTARWRFIRCAAVRGKQADALAGWGHEFLFELGSCSVFLPFDSADMMETDGAGGVMLGSNEVTGSPVIYDYTFRNNYNVTVLGESGTGKSTAVKTYVDNFLRMVRSRYGERQRVMMAIIDPHGEYAGLAERWGCRTVNLTAREELGMDPFRIMEHPDQAAGILCETVRMPPNLRSLVISKSEGCYSIGDLMTRLKSGGEHADEMEKASSYLEQFASGGISTMFRGEYGATDRTLFTLYKAEKNEINSMLVTMSMQRVWRDMRDAPSHVPKLFVIDEGWFAISMEASAFVLQDIAKSGRKENVHLMFLTQEPEDILKNSYGTAMLNNSATIMLLKLKPHSAETLRRALRLSKAETDAVQQLDVGHAIFLADAHRLKVRVRPDEEQLRAFDTRAGFGA